eukprot:TRINITY_DN71642_c0_g1_i1.p1 TRINITY_DN71642_c0_g1~~TRINITY_DN71642_c0_g1_i1.p1  ORF type:complete len:194 (-),score=48.32 TRINITY_DN71642_c0_g1_i1:133-714(-)
MAEAEPKVDIVSQAEFKRRLGPVLLEQGSTYRKVGTVFLRKASPGESVQTVIDGKVETENIANEGDMIVRADTQAKERYILSSAKFSKLYDATPSPIVDHPDADELRAEGFQAYKPCGRCLGMVATEEIIAEFAPGGKFIAAWGQPMLVEPGDILAAPAPPGHVGKPDFIVEVYRIEKACFGETYVPEDDASV